MKKRLTVHDLAADWGLWENADGFTVGSGRKVWEIARYGRGRLVYIARLDVTAEGLRVRERYVAPETPVNIIHREGDSHEHLIERADSP